MLGSIVVAACVLSPGEGVLAAESKGKASAKSAKAKAAPASKVHKSAQKTQGKSAKAAVASSKRAASATPRKKGAKSTAKSSGKSNARLRAQGKARRMARKDYHPPSAAIVVDANSGVDLLAENAGELRHPASLTKIMTLYMVFEQLEAGKLKISSPLAVSARAAVQPPTKLRLKAGETLTVEQAIKALVTRSANDAAVVIAEGIGGTVENFAARMTAKAHALGMGDTIYRNPSGLPNPEQVTTARDQATLARAVQDRFPQFYPYFSTRTFHFRGKTIGNHNHLLGSVTGVDGIKTGYTFASGYNLTTSLRRGSRHLVAVVFGGRSAGARDAYMRKIIEQHIGQVALVRTAPKIVEQVMVADSAPESSTLDVASTTEAVAGPDSIEALIEAHAPALVASSPSGPVTLAEILEASATTWPSVQDRETNAVDIEIASVPLSAALERIAQSEINLRPTQSGSEFETAAAKATAPAPASDVDRESRVAQARFALAGEPAAQISERLLGVGKAAQPRQGDVDDVDDVADTGAVTVVPADYAMANSSDADDALGEFSGPLSGALAGMFAGLIGFQVFRRGSRRRLDPRRRGRVKQA